MEQRVYWTHKLQSVFKGSQDRNVEAGTEMNTTELHWLPAFSQMNVQLTLT